MFLVWFAISLAAVLGASRVLPISGHGFSASEIAKNIVGIVIVFGSVAMVVSVSLIVMGLFRRGNAAS